MEGRTIVRPDQIAGRGNGVVVLPLQWRAGQSSGQTTGAERTLAESGSPSMEGRTIVRPDRHQPGNAHRMLCTFNGGPDNRPARRRRHQARALYLCGLQWRAGQSSGQTYGEVRDCRHRSGPSMEGRTIVRPDRDRVQRDALHRRPSMEGRTIVRPDPALRQSRRRITEPSMEGRTIVRPDVVGVERPPGTHRPFNGGPDNRPARPVLYGHTWKLIGSFNGGPDNRPARPPETSTRAQPISPTFNGGPDNRPARQGSLPPPTARCATFNGGPDNRPARPVKVDTSSSPTSNLQWRAGQSSGQTSLVNESRR